MSQEQMPAQNGQLPDISSMTDDEVLAYTRGVRVKVVQSLVKTGEVSPDNSDRILLTNMLNGLDSQALNSKKISADQKNADNTAAVVAELLRTINKNTAFTPLGGNSDNIIDVSARVVPNSIPDIPALPGEMDVAPAQMDYATFVRSQGRDIDELGKNHNHPEAADDD